MSKEITIKFKIPEFKRWFIFTTIFFRRAFRRALSDIRTKKYRGSIVLALAIGAYFLWDLSSALLWLLFLLFLVYEWENRIIGVLALISLASCPFLLQFKKDALAEQIVVYAYFFLVMTVILQIVEYKRHPEKYKEEK